MSAPLTLVDGVIIILTSLSALLAMARGCTREVLGILSVAGAGLLALYGSIPFEPILTQLIDLKPLAKALEAPVSNVAIWVCGAVLFTILWIVFSVFTHKLSRKVAASAAGGVDRGLGLIFGAVRGLLILGFVYAVYTGFVAEKNRPPALKEAKLIDVLNVSSDVVRNIADTILPEKVSQGLQENKETIEKKPVKKIDKETGETIELLIEKTAPLKEDEKSAAPAGKRLEEVLKKLEEQSKP